MSSNLVSVIVPVYKVEQYLNRCVSSIIKQSHTNLEIILVDDGHLIGVHSCVMNGLYRILALKWYIKRMVAYRMQEM